MDQSYVRASALEVDDLASQLNQMNVDMETTTGSQQYQQDEYHHPWPLQQIADGCQNSQSMHPFQQQQQLQHQNSFGSTNFLQIESTNNNSNNNFPHHQFATLEQMSDDLENCELMDDDSGVKLEEQQTELPNQALVVTSVDSSVFTDPMMQATFEGLFRVFDTSIVFRYFKNFRRVRLDFSSQCNAELALNNMREYKLGNSIFKCYTIQFIKSQTISTRHLMLPKMTRQFLISPPASPPEDWQPIHEGPPVIDVQLISAIANLVPGQTHEIHAGNESQPGIFVQVCEDVQYPTINTQNSLPSTDEKSASSKVRIPQTPRPM